MKHRARQYQAEMIRLYQEENMSFAKIATQFQISITTARVLVREQIPIQHRGVPLKTVEEMKQLFDEGLSYAKIAKRLKLSRSCVFSSLQKYYGISRNSQPRRSKYDPWIPEIIERYQSGESLKRIADHFKTNPQTISNCLERHGVARRNHSESRRVYALDELYFHVLTESKSYLLGVFFAKSHVRQSGGGTEIALSLLPSQREALIPLLETLTEMPKERQTSLRQHQKEVQLKLFSTLLATRLNALGLGAGTLPVDARLDEYAFWKGYFTYGVTFAPANQSYSVGFPTEELRDECLKFLSAQGFDCALIRQSEKRRLRFLKSNIQTQLFQFAPDILRFFPLPVSTSSSSRANEDVIC